MPLFTLDQLDPNEGKLSIYLDQYTYQEESGLTDQLDALICMSFILSDIHIVFYYELDSFNFSKMKKDLFCASIVNHDFANGNNKVSK